MRRAMLSAAALTLVATACTSAASAGDPTAPTTPTPSTAPASSFAGTDPAPEFPVGLDWLNTDRPLALSQLAGKVVLLDFWTYGCINCIHIIPDLERLETEFPDELVVIGVHSAKFDQEASTENIRQVVLRYDLHHPVVNDRDFEVWRAWGANAWPTTVLIDPAGNIVGGHSGEGVYDVMEPVIRSLVGEFDDRGQLDRRPLDIRLEKEGLPETILAFPGKVEADVSRERLFIADTNHHRIIVTDLEGNVRAVYGNGQPGLRDGVGVGARFQAPQGMVLAPDGETLYVADTDNHAIRAITLATGTVTTIVGDGLQASYPPTGGAFSTTRLSSPWDLELVGERLFVAMAGNHQIWELNLDTDAAAPLAGNGRESTRNGKRDEAELAQPSGISLGDHGRLYFADSESSAIRWVDIDPAGGDVGILAGSDRDLFDFGDADGVGTDARLQHPLGVSFTSGALYVADTYNSKIKVIDTATGATTTFLGETAGWRDGTSPLFYEPGGIDVAGGRLWVADTNNHAVRVVDLASGATTTILIRGIEAFTPSADDESFAGTVVVTEPVTVAAGPVTIDLDITLPPGHKVNEEAPSSMSWTAEGGVEFPAGQDQTLTGTHFPVSFPAIVGEDATSLTGDLNLIWCSNDAESLCFIEQARFTVPLLVTGRGGSRISLAHSVTFPDM